jgi:hypothetical protein
MAEAYALKSDPTWLCRPIQWGARVSLALRPPLCVRERDADKDRCDPRDQGACDDTR